MKLNVFHGSQENFDDIGTNNDVASYAVNGHHYFSASKEVAETYTNSNGVLYEMEVSFKNPLTIDCNGGNFNRLHLSLNWELLADIYEFMGYHKNYIAMLESQYNDSYIKGDDNIITISHVECYAVSKGYDSLVALGVKDTGHKIENPVSTTYVAFSSEQVKIVKKNKVA